MQFDAPHMPGTPPAPHACPAGQLPQLMTFPQPSPAGPHIKPSCVQVFGTQAWPASKLPPDVPHIPGTPPPPQVAGAVHMPQSIRLPQPSLVWPHIRF
jgi:hypothetical protein